MLAGEQAAVHSSHHSYKEAHGHQPAAGTWGDVPGMLAGEQAAELAVTTAFKRQPGH